VHGSRYKKESRIITNKIEQAQKIKNLTGGILTKRAHCFFVFFSINLDYGRGFFETHL